MIKQHIKQIEEYCENSWIAECGISFVPAIMPPISEYNSDEFRSAVCAKYRKKTEKLITKSIIKNHGTKPRN
ncbi:MAG: hypothetical protein H7321_09265 [Bacteroidia bacterium]|nr:hypothetical protein [Bacteroidia bacterium]